jgi:hypothetical protein
MIMGIVVAFSGFCGKASYYIVLNVRMALRTAFYFSGKFIWEAFD